MLKRFFSTSSPHSLRHILEKEVIPAKKHKLAELRKLHGHKTIGHIKLNDAIMGMRGMPLMFYDGSSIDPVVGLNFRGHTLPEFCKNAQKAPGGSEPLPQVLFFLLTADRYPTQQEFETLSGEWKERGRLSEEDIKVITSLPKNYHPMTMLSIAILSLQAQSKFYKAYHSGAKKSEYWTYYYEDTMDLLAKIPSIAAIIYRHLYKNGDIIKPDLTLDWAGNFAHMLGFTDNQVKECMRGYMSMHADHEGYNVSAHTSMLVGSALSDPYLSYSAALNGLAGPLHGLASQECLKWYTTLQDYHQGQSPNPLIIQEFVRKTVNEGRVVPGYGHAVLRGYDPRFLYLQGFSDKHIKGDYICDLAVACSKTIPDVMKSIGKVKNPYPNVDAFSGVLLHHYGIKQFEFYTVCFGVSRAIGCLTNGLWARAFGLPIERPNSFDMRYIQRLGEEKKE